MTALQGNESYLLACSAASLLQMGKIVLACQHLLNGLTDISKFLMSVTHILLEDLTIRYQMTTADQLSFFVAHT